MKKPTRYAVLYSRFSPQRNAADSDSCGTQEAQCLGHAATLGLEVRSMHRDEGVSGKDEYKPGLEDAIGALRKGDVLLVYSRCRLARDLYLAMYTENRVAKVGAEIVAVTGDVVGGGDPYAVAMRQMLSVFAELERKLIAARTKAAMRTKQANGEKISRYVKYGWKVDPGDPKRTVEDAREQSAVKRILAMACGGLTKNNIATRMNKEMPDYCRKAKWYPITVGKIIARESA